MKKKSLVLSLFFLLLTGLQAQKDLRTFIFGHSLINHELQVNPTPSQETSVPHWFHFLAQAGGHGYAVDGQYGFLAQHANLPPIAQWGFDVASGAWDSDNEPFSAADFNSILITPGNFIQWQGPAVNYYNETFSPLDATQTIFEWCNEQEEDLTFYIYENWPDMGPYLSNGFPPTDQEWDNYLDYLNGDFHEWFVAYHDALTADFPGVCIRMIPVGPLINNLVQQPPFNEIPITELYEDDAPHGRASTYFLAALVTYMALYEEQVPEDFVVDGIIHPIIRDNYQQAVAYLWEGLLNFDFENGSSRTFCEEPLMTALEQTPKEQPEVKVFPNPTKDELTIRTESDAWIVELYDWTGKRLLQERQGKEGTGELDLRELANGTYLMVIRDSIFNIIGSEKVIKMR
ncbi:MAG: T9SS type A sorting domain-containing protein [Saprospiraceae bacterium]|nr:T9SS type A sorting domain-containing protein [Saprospiraceae bacterium]